MLMDYFKKENITLNAEAKNWEEAIAISGRTLVDNESIEERYIDAMIKAVKDLGPYIVVAPKIAIAHARPVDGVNRCGFAITTLKDPVKFGNEANDPVCIVITISAIDHDGHLEALSELMTLIENTQMCNKIIESENVNEVYSIIEGLMK